MDAPGFAAGDRRVLLLAREEALFLELVEPVPVLARELVVEDGVLEAEVTEHHPGDGAGLFGRDLAPDHERALDRPRELVLVDHGHGNGPYPPLAKNVSGEAAGDRGSFPPVEGAAVGPVVGLLRPVRSYAGADRSSRRSLGAEGSWCRSSGRSWRRASPR